MIFSGSRQNHFLQKSSLRKNDFLRVLFGELLSGELLIDFVFLETCDICLLMKVGECFPGDSFERLEVVLIVSRDDLDFFTLE